MSTRGHLDGAGDQRGGRNRRCRAARRPRSGPGRAAPPPGARRRSSAAASAPSSSDERDPGLPRRGAPAACRPCRRAPARSSSARSTAKPGVAGDGQLQHGGPVVGEAAWRPALERLLAGRHEPELVQAQRLGGDLADDQMAVMDGIERAAEEADQRMRAHDAPGVWSGTTSPTRGRSAMEPADVAAGLLHVLLVAQRPVRLDQMDQRVRRHRVRGIVGDQVLQVQDGRVVRLETEVVQRRLVFLVAKRSCSSSIRSCARLAAVRARDTG